MTVTADAHNPATATGVIVTTGATTTEDFVLQTGFIEGTVTDAGGPLAGAVVSLDTTPYSATTNASGFYSIQCPVATYDMTCTAVGHIDATATGVPVLDGTTTTQDFYLASPEIDVTPMSHTVTLPYGNTDTRTVTIDNLGDGPLDFGVSFTNFGEAKNGGNALWDILAEYDIGTLTADTQILGTEWLDGSLWFTGGNSAADPNNIYEVSSDGTTVLNTYAQPAGASGWGLRDLATDGTYLYGGAETVFVQIDPSDGSIVASVPNSLANTIRALAYNPASGTFFCGDFANPIREFSFDGSSVTEIRNFSLGLTAKYGMAWDDVSPGGPFLWIFDQVGAVTGTTVYQADVSTVGSEVLTGVSYEIPMGTGQTSQIAGGMFLATDFIPGKVVLGCQYQSDTDLFVALELGDFATWISGTPLTGTVPVGGPAVDITLTFDSNEVAGPGTYTCDMKIDNNDADENPTIVDLTMIVTGGGTLEGYVYDGNGDPLPGATVTITELGRTRTSDGTGFYQFTYVPAGTYTVRATLSGYVTDEYTGVSVSDGMTTTQDFSLDFADIDLNITTYEKWMMPGVSETDTGALTVGNLGSIDLNWATSVSYAPAVPLDILVITADNTAGYDISALTDVMDANPAAFNYTLWDVYSTTPTVAELAPYDIVVCANNLIWTSTSINTTTLSDNLADYLDAGGGLLIAAACWSDTFGIAGGRLITDEYTPFGRETGIILTYHNIANIPDPTHPVMRGVTTTSLTQIFLHHGGVPLVTGATLLADYDDGDPFVGIKGMCIGINTLICDGHESTGNWDTLISNALLYLGGVDAGWLTLTPDFGTTTPAGSTPVDFTFDATTLALGTYYANIVVTSNDSSGMTYNIPVTLNVSNVTPTPTTPPVIPATGPAGLALLLLALGGLLGIGSLPRRK